MMARKRASVKGKGADIFLPGQGEQAGEPRPVPTRAHKKATFYLPPDLLDQLDDAWLDLRRLNRDVKKSDLVRTALRAALADYATNQEKSHLYKEILGDTSS